MAKQQITLEQRRVKIAGSEGKPSCVPGYCEPLSQREPQPPCLHIPGSSLIPQPGSFPRQSQTSRDQLRSKGTAAHPERVSTYQGCVCRHEEWPGPDPESSQSLAERFWLSFTVPCPSSRHWLGHPLQACLTYIINSPSAAIGKGVLPMAAH